MNRLNNPNDARTKRAFAYTAIAEAKATQDPYDVRRAYQVTFEAYRAGTKGRHLIGNILGALGVEALHYYQGEISRGRPRQDAGEAAFFMVTAPGNLGNFQRAAANTGNALRVWPHLLPTDYEEFFAVRQEHEDRFRSRLTAANSFSPRQLAAHHFARFSVLMEIVDSYGEGMIPVMDEFYRLSMNDSSKSREIRLPGS